MSRAEIEAVETLDELAGLLRRLRRREARQRGDSELTYRELAAKTGWSHATVGEYLAGQTLPPTDRFDVLVQLLGASGPELRALADARDRVDEARRRTRAVALERATTPPHELPAGVSAFTGRSAQLAELDAYLQRGGDAVPIAVLSGTAGVGKTCLALCWAHRVAGRFADGQLFVNLRGYDPGQQVTPRAALAGLLLRLGVPAACIPYEVDACAARFRSLLAGRRVLLVLDNARSAEQVRPLLPGSASAFVVVTSRDALPGLVARDGAYRIDLDVLTEPEALALLRELIGERVSADPDAARTLVRRCSGLPLALRLAAELAVASPRLALGDLLDEQRRLDLLDAGDDRFSRIRSVFSWSVRHLRRDTADAFGLLGVHPGEDIDVGAFAALTASSVEPARRMLSELERAHLVREVRPGRYGMHDLLRAYAAERAPDAGEAMDALLAYYVEATRRLVGGRADVSADARRWLELELPNLLAMARCGLARDRLGAVGELAREIGRYLHYTGQYATAIGLHEEVLRASRTAGDRALEAAAANFLGAANSRLGRTTEALVQHQRALALASAIGDAVLRGAALNNLGLLYSSLGRHAEALAHLQDALAVARAVGNQRGEASALGNLGYAYTNAGAYAAALDCHRQNLAIAVERRDRIAEAIALGNLGRVYQKLDRHPEAVDHLRQALELGREVNARSSQVYDHNTLGETLLAMGQPAQSYAEHDAALDLARQLGERQEEARALDGLAHALRQLDRSAEAVAAWEQALAIYVELDAPEAETVRAQLERGS